MHVIEYFIMAMVAALSGCGLALVLTSWLRKNKNSADWAMAMGALFALAGAMCVAAMMAGYSIIRDIQEAIVVVGGLGTMGVIIFTMGFAVDRVKYYRKEKADDYRERNLPPQ